MYRRQFLRQSGSATGLIVAAPSLAFDYVRRNPLETINIAVVGVSGSRPRVRGMIGGRGMHHIRMYSEIPNVRVAAICDVDERLLPAAAAEVGTRFGKMPKTYVDFRKLLDDKDIDAVSLAVPDHWHALMTVWACRAGKDVYVEKPVHQFIAEGKKMIEAARKYNRIVQSGICYRDSRAVKEGIQFVQDGNLGKVYMAKGITYRYRASIEHVEDSAIPEGVHWDMFLGPAPYRPFNLNRYIYNWHWFWDTGTTEFGNNGIYRMDTVRWALNKNTHPVKVHCTGGKFGREDDQEVPNILIANYEYEDGMIIQNEVRSLPTNPEGLTDSGDCFIFSDQGWMTFNSDGYRTYFGRQNEPGPAKSDEDFPEEERGNGWKNFIECMRSRKTEDLDNDIREGHMSAVLGHLGIISYRTGRKLVFDPATETFPGDPEAGSYLARSYRSPYTMPDQV
jgi:predicted dehydrogenase